MLKRKCAKPNHQPATAARHGERLAWINQTKPVNETTSRGRACPGGSAVAERAPRPAAIPERRQPEAAPSVCVTAASHAAAERPKPLTGDRAPGVIRCG